MKTILRFIRITEAGVFELVTWTKDKAGIKSLSKRPAQPSADQLQRLMSSLYGELILATNEPA